MSLRFLKACCCFQKEGNHHTKQITFLESASNVALLRVALTQQAHRKVMSLFSLNPHELGHSLSSGQKCSSKQRQLIF